MSSSTNQQEMLQLAAKLGVPLSAHAGELAFLQLHEIRILDLLPEMMVMIRSLVSRKSFSFQRDPITVIERGLLVSFQNVFNDGREESNGWPQRLNQEQPHVRLMPLQMESEVRFTEQSHYKQITLLIEMDYLKRLLGKQEHKFHYLFEVDSTFWIEDFMSPQMAAIVDEMVNTSSEVILPDFHYRMKSLQLLYALFKNLSLRESVPFQPISSYEINAIYQVRNAMAASLDKALSTEELIKLSGMNEVKLRKLFTQVFGKGLYPYYQNLRMKEAARLLKEERLSVSETGYRLGFTNLSYFGRLFEEHFGMKPKKWSTKK
jgi:AraC-like DNA-binding protein